MILIFFFQGIQSVQIFGSLCQEQQG
uniref:Uncharacterized protein n=1 Tax=Rhizophora mucronata TaxID=61149 RepID=A0A2P2P348_RHIMU